MMSIKEHLKAYIPPLLAIVYALWGVYLYYDAYIVVGKKYWLYSMFDHDELWFKIIIGLFLFFWCVYMQLKTKVSRAVFSILVASLAVTTWRNSVGDSIIEALDTQESRNVAIYNHPIGYEYLVSYIFWLVATAIALYFLLQLMSKYMFVKKESIPGDAPVSVSRFPTLRGNLVKLGLTYPIFIIVFMAVSLIAGDLRVDSFISLFSMLAAPLMFFAFFAKPGVVWQRKALAFYGGTLLGWMAYGMYQQSMVVCGYGCSSPARTVIADSFGAFIFGLVFVGGYALVLAVLTFFIRRSNAKKGIVEPAEGTPASTNILSRLKSIPFDGALFTILVIILIVISPFHPEKQRIGKSEGIYIACVGADRTKLLESERSLPTEVESCTPEKHIVAGKEVLHARIGYMANCGGIDCLYTKNFVFVDGKILPIAEKPQNPFNLSKNGVDPIRDRFGCDNVKIVDNRYLGLSYTRASLVFDNGTYRWMLEYDNVPTVDKYGNTCSVSGYQIDTGAEVFDYGLTVSHLKILTPAECPQPRDKDALNSYAQTYEMSNDPSYAKKDYAEYEMCLRSIAVASRNHNICSGILNRSIKGGCYEDVARTTLDESLCNFMTKDYQYSSQEYCRTSIKNFKAHERIIDAPSPQASP